jgi:gamma-glutamyl hercynylcysteine S-oxide hydrolase
VVVASEPWDDDPRWRSVPDHHLVTARLTGAGTAVEIRPLDEEGPT